jgi:hypothetical protein
LRIIRFLFILAPDVNHYLCLLINIIEGQIMSAKQTATALINNLADDASWSDVKDVLMGEYKKETGDAKADAVAAVIICSVFVTACVFWISGQ